MDDFLFPSIDILISLLYIVCLTGAGAENFSSEILVSFVMTFIVARVLFGTIICGSWKY